MDEFEVGMPLLGDKAPSFEAQTTQGKIRFPDDFKGKWVVLFSHPADFTPVCTTEFYAFQKRYDQFKKLGVQLVGLSIDQVFSHIKWTEWIKDNFGVEIKFPIIADDMGNVALLYGMVHPGKGTNTVRSVFVIDPKGVLRAILYYPQEVGRDVDEILRLVKALQTSDKTGLAMPHKWPENELVGDHGIVPPADDEKTAKQRLKDAKAKKIECFDWWLCHKKITKK